MEMGFLVQSKLKLSLVESSFPKVIGFGFWQSPKHPKSFLMHLAWQDVMYDNWVYLDKMLLHSKWFVQQYLMQFYKRLGSTTVDSWPVYLRGFPFKRMP